ncbi:RDD family protein [Staphylococcus chromogenes]|nr:RDD family protein [Staphylococcus chromogenes]
MLRPRRFERMIAYFIDSILFAILATACSAAARYFWAEMPSYQFEENSLLGFGIYKVACELTAGQTIGHWLASIKATYERPAWWRPFVRNSWALLPGILKLAFPQFFAYQDWSEILAAILCISVLFGARSVFDWLAGARMESTSKPAYCEPAVSES